MIERTDMVTRFTGEECIEMAYNQITDIPLTQIGDEVIIDSDKYTVEQIDGYAARLGIKLKFSLNGFNDHHITIHGWSFRKALLANLASEEAGEVTIPMLKSVQMSSMRTVGYVLANEHDKYIKVKKVALNQVRVTWGNKCDKPTRTWRSWTREILDALEYQQSFDFNDYPEVTSEMISSEIHKSDKLFTVRKGVVTRNKAKVKQFKGEFHLMYENKYNRVVHLPRMTTRRYIPMADQRLVRNWLMENEPNYLDFLFGSNTIEYTQVEFKTPPPSLPRLEQ